MQQLLVPAQCTGCVSSTSRLPPEKQLLRIGDELGCTSAVLQALGRPATGGAMTEDESVHLASAGATP